MGEKSIYRGMAADPTGPWRDLDAFSKQMALDRVMEQAKSFGLPAEMVQYLESRGRMPSVVGKGYLPYNASGEFEYPAWGADPQLGLAGQVSLNKGLLNKNTVTEGARTLSHELSHATDRQLHWQAGDKSPENAQFRQAYDKLLSGPTLANNFVAPREALIKKIAPPAWVERNKDYRATPNEAMAFGVGNSMTDKNPDNIYRAPQHLDPTLATELAILLELAQRKKK